MDSQYGWSDSPAFQHIYPPHNPDFPNTPNEPQFLDDIPHEDLSAFELGHRSPEPSSNILHDEPNSTSMAAPPRTASRRSKYKGLDWDEHKPKIKELYLDEDRSLSETMRIMKEAYSFNAS